jgi:hypothetical protein
MLARTPTRPPHCFLQLCRYANEALRYAKNNRVRRESVYGYSATDGHACNVPGSTSSNSVGKVSVRACVRVCVRARVCVCVHVRVSNSVGKVRRGSARGPPEGGISVSVLRAGRPPPVDCPLV